MWKRTPELHPKRNKISQTRTGHGRQCPLWRDGTRYPAVDHLSKVKRRHFLLFSDIARRDGETSVFWLQPCSWLIGFYKS